MKHLNFITAYFNYDVIGRISKREPSLLFLKCMSVENIMSSNVLLHSNCTMLIVHIYSIVFNLGSDNLHVTQRIFSIKFNFMKRMTFFPRKHCQLFKTLTFPSSLRRNVCFIFSLTKL